MALPPPLPPAADDPELSSSPEAEDTPRGGSTALPPAEDSYFEDDDLLLAGDSHSLVEEQGQGAVQNLEDVVFWRVDSFYTDEGKVRKKLSLRENPPEFFVWKSGGDEVRIVVSKDIARDFARIFGDINNAYHGVYSPQALGTKEKQTFTSWLHERETWAKEHPGKSFALLLFLLFLAYALIISF